jgi:hypothetical protein
MEDGNSSWLKLLGYCVTMIFVSAVALAILLATATLAMALAQPDNPSDPASTPTKTLSGVVTDSFCGARHKDSGRSSAECARDCMRNGAKYMLVSGDDKYMLAGNPAILNGLIGERVRINGILKDNTLRVGSVSFAP